MSKVNFSYKGTRRGIIASILAAVTLASGLVIFGVNPNQPTDSLYGGTEYPATLAAMANGCGNIFLSPPPEENGFGVIPDKFWEVNKGKTVNIPTHAMIIPVYGYMSKDTFPEDAVRFYAPDEITEPVDRERLLRTMYDRDITVIWYTRDIEPSDLVLIKETANDNPGEIMALPWDYAGGQLIGTRTVAYARWGISQSCGFYNQGILEAFMDFADENKLPRVDPIPEVKMFENGTLYPILNKAKVD